MRVRCQQCDKLVDRWELEYLEERRETHVRVWCHGDADTCIVRDSDVRDAGPAMNWDEGTAFTTARIPHNGENT
jgi:hypothetical protein